MHYDHISFHTEENYPAELPLSNATHHIGYYYAWAVSQNLHSDAAATLPQFAQLQKGEISGATFVQNQLGGGIDETCFNELGNRFTQYYYDDDEDGYGHFMTDYFLALGINNIEQFYHTSDNAENQAKLNPVFQAAFEKWQHTLSKHY